jgi:dynactin complex subunit
MNTTDETIEQHRIRELERDVERLYARTKEMEAEFRRQYADLDRKYVRLERYITVERAVYAFIGALALAVAGLVWSSVVGS